jgi:Lrp/AsnC family transcriptional regulator, leucine-responsive regulatory protein
LGSEPKKEREKWTMAENSEKLLDDVGWQLLYFLQEHARLSFKELGQRVGLAPSSVAERIHRMEEAEILLGYHAEINLEKVGLPVMAFIRMSTPGQNSARIALLLVALPEILECYRLTGSEAFIMKVCVCSVKQLEVLIDQLSQYGQPTTSLVLSIPLTRRILEKR